MKKLLKSVICGSVNSARIQCLLWKVNICGYCSMNSKRITPKRVKTKQKKKKNENTASQTQTQLQWNPNGHYITLKFNKILVFFFFSCYSH